MVNERNVVDTFLSAAEKFLFWPAGNIRSRAEEEKVRITPGVRAAVSDSLSGSGLGEECGRIAGPAFLVQGRRRKNIYFLNDFWLGYILCIPIWNPCREEAV